MERVMAAADGLEQATSGLSHAISDSNIPEAGEAVAGLAAAHEQTLELARELTRARQTINDIAARLVDLGGRAGQVTSTLPPGVPGAETRGGWLGPTNAWTVLRSGRGSRWYDAARQLADSWGEPDRRAGRLATHVEVQMAMRMHATGSTRETIVIDRKVCGRDGRNTGLFTCNEFLADFLPSGTELTIVEGDGTVVTYQGREEP
jgi:hypothetical protein